MPSISLVHHEGGDKSNGTTDAGDRDGTLRGAGCRDGGVFGVAFGGAEGCARGGVTAPEVAVGGGRLQILDRSAACDEAVSLIKPGSPRLMFVVSAHDCPVPIA